METLKINNLGPVKYADIKFGDLTLFVGPQASGKSIVLQLIKLLHDKNHIRKTLEQYGFIWGAEAPNILNRYFGEGMAEIWNPNTKIVFNGKPFSETDLLPKRNNQIKTAEESLFYIPAQRVVCLQNGWPRFFTDYEDSVPYVLRQFSETLRQLLESSPDKSDTVFPQKNRLKTVLRDSFTNSIFHGGTIVIDTHIKRRFKLEIDSESGKSSIPYMAWSAGQKEFMPLLLSFYWLCPPSKVSLNGSIKFVILEEPEMGLHPQAINAVLLQVADLMHRGYKVIISTHSPVLLEFAWAFNLIKQYKADYKTLAELFGISKGSMPPLKEMLTDLSGKEINTYYFNRINSEVAVKDISVLDAGSDDPAMAEWGGLSSFAAKATDIVLKLSANG